MQQSVYINQQNAYINQQSEYVNQQSVYTSQQTKYKWDWRSKSKIAWIPFESPEKQYY